VTAVCLAARSRDTLTYNLEIYDAVPRWREFKVDSTSEAAGVLLLRYQVVDNESGKMGKCVSMSEINKKKRERKIEEHEKVFNFHSDEHWRALLFFSSRALIVLLE
jgi:hypothetical protein